jgi:acyl carrier protein
MEKEKILDIVMKQVEELRDSFPENEKFDVTTRTILFGKDSRLDSLSLVTLIVELETLFTNEYGIEISLTDDNAMTRKISPFDSISTLSSYIDEMINGVKNA